MLPGIMGSELTGPDGTVLWGVSWRMIWNRLKSGGFAALTVGQDDKTSDVLADGVTATRLIPCAHLIPGFWKIDFYTEAVDRIDSAFENTIRGVATVDAVRAAPILGLDTSGAERPANLIEFPYDWRRDNRSAANRLDRLVGPQLSAIKKSTGGMPRVILVAHSMGGLVARYYLQKLGGWGRCRALYTYGTPYRGSPQALDYLLNGYPGMPGYVTGVLRSMTAVHQLLPYYPAVHDGGGGDCMHVRDAPGLPGTIARDAGLAWSGFHETMIPPNGPTLRSDQLFVAFVGVGQRTVQALRLKDTSYVASPEVPPDFKDPGGVYAGGDSTVPRISATPQEYSAGQVEHFVVEKHSSLLTNRAVLDDLVQRLRELQGPSLGNILLGAGAAGFEASTAGAALGLELDDKYEQGEPVSIRLRLNAAAESEPVVKVLRVEGGAAGAVPVTAVARPMADGSWEVTIPPLESDLYRVEARVTVAGTGASLEVHDVFVVDDPSDTEAEAAR